MKKLFLLAFSLLLLHANSSAQLLKKITKRVEQKVERTVVEKVSDEAARKTDKQLDKLFNMEIAPFPTKGEKVKKEDLPSNYSFDYKYELQMEHQKRTMKMTYFLKKDEAYFGAKLPSQGLGNMFMVFDTEKQLTLIFMENEGKKMVTAMKTNMPIDDVIDQEYNDTFTYSKLDETKTILGYECQGIQAENDEYIMTMFFAQNIKGPSFNDVWKFDQKNMPKGYKPGMIEGDPNDTLMLEMDMKHKKKKKQDAKMTCTGYGPVTKEISVKDYEYPY